MKKSKGIFFYHEYDNLLNDVQDGEFTPLLGLLFRYDRGEKIDLSTSGLSEQTKGVFLRIKQDIDKRNKWA